MVHSNNSIYGVLVKNKTGKRDGARTTTAVNQIRLRTTGLSASSGSTVWRTAKLFMMRYARLLPSTGSFVKRAYSVAGYDIWNIPHFCYADKSRLIQPTTVFAFLFN